MRRVRCSAVDGAQGKGASRVRSEIKVALRMSCCTVDRTCPWNAASGYFLTVWHHGTRHVPWCQTVQPERAFVADRADPAARPAARSTCGEAATIGSVAHARPLSCISARIWSVPSSHVPVGSISAEAPGELNVEHIEVEIADLVEG